MKVSKIFNRLSAVVFIALFLIILDLAWLSIFLLLLIFIYKIVICGISCIKYIFLRKALKSFFFILFIFFIAISTKLVVFDIYKIPSNSMQSTLVPNDVILVNKLAFGPKLPQSPFEIPWVNIAYHFNKKAKVRINETWWAYKRLSGASTIKKGDIIVFDMESNNGNKRTIVKRCVGLPGNALEIRNGVVFIDNKSFSPSEKILNSYRFKTTNPRELYRILDSLDINIELISDLKKSGWSSATLSIFDKRALENIELIDTLGIDLDTISGKGNLYPNSPYTQWNLDNYGAYKIPIKGMEIALTLENFALYKSVFNKYEKAAIIQKDGRFYIKNKEVSSYTFTSNYYFMMGDNRKGSIDSRFWGVVPEKFVVGKVTNVLFSNYMGKFQWSRFFKMVK